MAKVILSEKDIARSTKLPDLNLYYRPIITKPIQYVHVHTHTHQTNKTTGIYNPEINP